MMKTEAPEQDIIQTIGILNEAGFGNGKIKIAYDEWNLRNWHHPWHGNFRKGFIVDIACFAPVVNTRGPLFVHPDGIVKRTTYYIFWMYTNLLEDFMVPTSVKAGKLTKGERSVNVMDGILTANVDKSRFVYAIVNKHPDQSQEIALDFSGIGKETPRKIKGYVLSGSTPDDYNAIDLERVKPEEHTFNVRKAKVTLPAHSLTMLIIE